MGLGLSTQCEVKVGRTAGMHQSFVIIVHFNTICKLHLIIFSFDHSLNKKIVKKVVIKKNYKNSFDRSFYISHLKSWKNDLITELINMIK